MAGIAEYLKDTTREISNIKEFEHGKAIDE